MPLLKPKSENEKKVMLTALFLNRLKKLLTLSKKERLFDSVESVSFENNLVLITTRKPIVNVWLSAHVQEIRECLDASCHDIGVSLGAPDILFR